MDEQTVVRHMLVPHGQGLGDPHTGGRKQPDQNRIHQRAEGLIGLPGAHYDDAAVRLLLARAAFGYRDDPTVRPLSGCTSWGDRHNTAVLALATGPPLSYRDNTTVSPLPTRCTWRNRHDTPIFAFASSPPFAYRDDAAIGPLSAGSTSGNGYRMSVRSCAFGCHWRSVTVLARAEYVFAVVNCNGWLFDLGHELFARVLTPECGRAALASARSSSTPSTGRIVSPKSSIASPRCRRPDCRSSSFGIERWSSSGQSTLS